MRFLLLRSNMFAVLLCIASFYMYNSTADRALAPFYFAAKRKIEVIN